MKPKRIQRKRTRGWKMPPNTVYVGRPTRWGNPFIIGEQHPFYEHTYPMSREKCVELFGLFLRGKWLRLESIDVDDVKKELRGKNLACWCKIGEPCHADVLLEIANEDAPNAR